MLARNRASLQTMIGNMNHCFRWMEKTNPEGLVLFYIIIIPSVITAVLNLWSLVRWKYWVWEPTDTPLATILFPLWIGSCVLVLYVYRQARAEGVFKHPGSQTLNGVKRMRTLKEYRKKWKLEYERNKKALKHIKKNNFECYLLSCAISAFYVIVLMLLLVVAVAELLGITPLLNYATAQDLLWLALMMLFSLFAALILSEYGISQARREIGLPLKRR